MGGHLLSGRMSPPLSKIWESTFSQAECLPLLPTMGGRLLWGIRSSPSPSNGRPHFLRQNVPPFYHQWEATFSQAECPPLSPIYGRPPSFRENVSPFYQQWEAAFSGAEGPPLLQAMGGHFYSGRMSPPSTTNGMEPSLR